MDAAGCNAGAGACRYRPRWRWRFDGRGRPWAPNRTQAQAQAQVPRRWPWVCPHRDSARCHTAAAVSGVPREAGGAVFPGSLEGIDQDCFDPWCEQHDGGTALWCANASPARAGTARLTDLPPPTGDRRAAASAARGPIPNAGRRAVNQTSSNSKENPTLRHSASSARNVKSLKGWSASQARSTRTAMASPRADTEKGKG